MNDNTFNYFLFSIAVLVSLGITVLALSCGENIMKAFKIIGFVFVAVLCIFFFIIAAFLIFKTPDQQNTKSWWVYTKDAVIPNGTKRILFYDSSEKIETLNLKKLTKLTMLGFDMTQWNIEKELFSNCKNLKEVTFYQKPKEFDENAFAKCPLLKTVKLVGNISDWKDFKIILPMDCEIEFLTTKEIVIIDNKINKTITDVDFEIKKTVEVVFSNDKIASLKKQSTFLENKSEPEEQTSSVDVIEE